MNPSQADAPAVTKDEKQEPANARVRIPAGCNCNLTGFSTAQVEKTVTVTITGKVIELESSAKEWYSGRSIEIEPTDIKVSGPALEKMGIADALEAAGVKLS